MSHANASQTVVLSLISHTNVGKTTLARTLLRDDIGEVADQAHVTDVNAAFALIEAPGGYKMVLWDTPGFGNVAALLTRLLQSASPIGWLLSQVWDRFRDRPLWCSQQAVKNVQAEADVVLYLVDANQNPDLAGYLDLEMQILEWIGKPVVVALNQLGPSEGPEQEQASTDRWKAALRRYGVVRNTLPLDAFARCWTQETRLFDAIGPQLPAGKQVAFTALRQAWQDRSLAIFQNAMEILATQLSGSARERAVIKTATWQQKARVVIGPLIGKKVDGPTEQAIEELNERLNAAIVASTNRLISLHQLEGKSGQAVLEDLRTAVLVDQPIEEITAGFATAIVAGALGGLTADLAAGGLTLGGGAIIGAVLGGAGAIALTRGYNRVWRKGRAEVRCSTELLVRLLQGALLRYVAVAHFGRGRGPWMETQAPKAWRSEIERAVQDDRRRVEHALGLARAGSPSSAELLARILQALAITVLTRLHPGTDGVFGPAKHAG